MKIFKSGDLVRLADSELEMLIICYEEESDIPDEFCSRWRCAWEYEGAIATLKVNECKLVLIRPERRRLSRFYLKFPILGRC